ncbi:MAG: glycoside hydrolase family 3 C-terminal domain-containing protein [Clostridiales bacterium]|nr:glycoside hydrolase family 3 C-terminal domain-containing protein [Clostridiales bacterium]
MEKKVKKPKKTSVVIISILLVVLLAVNIAGGMFYNVITQFFSKADVDKEKTAEASEAAGKVVEEIVDEGAVLLHNENEALPLDMDSEKEKKVNVFGWSSVHPVYSGVGTGAGNTENCISLYEGLENAGISANPELEQFYEESDLESNTVDSMGTFNTDYCKIQIPVDEYSNEMLEQAKEYSDVALIFLSRTGGEGYEDLPLDMSSLGGTPDEHYLELSQEEKELINMVDNMGFGKVILLLNSSYPMELRFLEEGKVDAALWIGGMGETGMNSVGSILSGEVNPSGRTVDTYAYDLTSAPAVENFGSFSYTDSEFMASVFGGKEEEVRQGYADYAEGIYVGYRYYETRWVDNETGEVNEEEYRKAVQYPFGYGLSYTTFEQEIADFTSDDKNINMTVKVTNTGNAAGKEVVQVYYTAPYQTGGIEKSHVVLADFGKTKLLEPGESEEIKISFAVEEMASFDYITNGCYVLEEGTYEVKLMKNAHDIIDTRDYTVDSTIIYDEGNKRDSDETAAVARFKDIENDGVTEITYVSRADWEGTIPKDVPHERAASEELKKAWEDLTPPEDPEAEDIVIRDNGLKLQDLIGKSYDDPMWEKLLEQLSVEDMQYLIGYGGFATQVIESVDKPYTIDLDGPAGIKALVNETAYEGISYTTGVVLASTWNQELAEKMGEAFSAEAVAWGISGIYGPTINIHRTQFNGRGYEGYSEDPVVAGKMAAGLITGFNTNKVYNYVKHFAIYNQCANTLTGLNIWGNEQAIREIYLRPFEIAVKEGNAHAMMSSYNRIGAKWSGSVKELMTDVLRGEWGFEGMVISDWVTADCMNADQGIHAGNDLMLDTVGSPVNDTSNAGKQAMRKACHNILYTVANSTAMDIGYYGPTPYWLYILIAVDVIAVVGAGAFYWKWRKNWKNFKKNVHVGENGK